MNLWTELTIEADLSDYGGKSVGLQKLIKKNLPIPKTIALSCTFFNEIYELLGIDSERDRLIKNFSNLNSSIEDLRRTCQQFQFNFLEKELPLKHVNLLKDLFYKYKKEYGSFCIRSSANFEDNKNYSFAGQFDSYLNVSTLDNFIKAIKDSAVQLFKFEVIHYCLKNNLNPLDIKISVVIQEYRPASIYGVLFTKDPSFLNADKMIINIGKNGESLMAGGITGDCIYVSDIEEDLPKSLKSLKKNIHKLLEISKDLDVEFGIDNDQVIFYQCRPITYANINLTSKVKWSRGLAEERYPEPISPLGWSILRDVFETNLKTLKERFGLKASSPDDVAITIGHYVFANDQYFALSNMRPDFLSLLPNIFKLILGLILTLIYIPIYLFFKSLHLVPFGIKDYLLMGGYKFFIFLHAKDIKKQWDKNLASLIAEFDELTKENISGYSLAQLYNYKYRLSLVGDRYMEPDLAIYIVKMACEYLVKRLGKMYSQDPLKFLTSISSGLENNRTLQMAKSIDDLTVTLKKYPHVRSYLDLLDFEGFYAVANSEVLEAMEKFEKSNGHLTVNWDFRVPTWQENKIELFKMIKCLLLEDNRKDIERKISQKNENFKKFDLQFKKELAIGSLISFYDELKFYLREFMRIDEEHHFYCSRVFRALRKLYLEMGQRLVEAEVIGESEDIFYLTSQELDEILKSNSFFTRRFVVENRKKSFSSSFKNRPADEYVKGKAIYNQIVERDGRFIGVGASPGVAQGRVVIIKNLSDCDQVKLGDIIVTQTPNPVYVPLYSLASAIVSNTGSILSHGMVAAREYEIPAVIGIANIASILKNGQKVEVDGNSGTIAIIN